MTTADHAGVDGEHPAAPNNKMNPHGATSPVEGLTLGPGLVLPVEAVTETFAILAKRGAGKTYTAAVLVEEMMGAGLPVVIVDPVGVWWGLRSSADGTAEGLPVVIFGGDHADLPLAETAGGLADLVVDERVPAVLDLSTLSKSAGRRFMTDFAERLYHRNRDPLHLVLDEADAFAPQRTDPGGQRLLGAIEDLVRRGRARGIGVTLITQRPAVLNKDVLTQAEVLIALRMTGPRDVAAIDEWVRLHAEEDQATEVKRSLPSLPVGTAWVWSPGWLGLLQRVAVRARTTFDSSATPKAGQRRITPTLWRRWTWLRSGNGSPRWPTKRPPPTPLSCAAALPSSNGNSPHSVPPHPASSGSRSPCSIRPPQTGSNTGPLTSDTCATIWAPPAPRSATSSRPRGPCQLHRRLCLRHRQPLPHAGHNHSPPAPLRPTNVRRRGITRPRIGRSATNPMRYRRSRPVHGGC